MMKIMAWMAMLCSIIGGVVETILVRKLMEIFLRLGDYRSAHITAVVFVFVILPLFIVTGLYAKRHLR